MLSSSLVSKQAASMLHRRACAIIRCRHIGTVGSTTVTNDAWRTMSLPSTLHELSYAAPTWSHSLSSIPERQPSVNNNNNNETTATTNEAWRTTPISNTLHELSYAAPTWSHSLSLASPETDFATAPNKTPPQSPWISQNDHSNQDHTSFFSSAPSTALGSVSVLEFLDDATKQQLFQDNNNNLQVLRDYEPCEEDTTTSIPLPKTLQQAMGNRTTDPRAMVVTKLDPPFEIVDVNAAWVGLCGYTPEESRHQTLGALLQQGNNNNNNSPTRDSDDTTRSRIQEAIAKLQRHEPASTVVTNYTKEGREFRNHVTMGPLYDSQGHLTHFVGVLREVSMNKE